MITLKFDAQEDIAENFLNMLGVKYSSKDIGNIVVNFGNNLIKSNKPVLYVPTGQKLSLPGLFRNIPFHFLADKIGELDKVYWDTGNEPVFYRLKSKNVYVFRIDILNSSAYFMNLEHEKGAELDKHERVKRPANFDPSQPVINYYVLWLKELLEIIASEEGIHLQFEPLWRGHKFAVVLTHDVDYIGAWRFFSLYRLLEELKSGKLKTSFRLGLQSLNPFARNPLWSFERLIEIERRHGVKSTFFFLDSPGNSLTAFLKGTSTYSIDKQELASLFKFLLEYDIEIALHGSYKSYKSKEMMLEEKLHLEKVTGREIEGIRQHYLRFSYPETWRAQAEAGFKYDSTLAYPESPGFRSAVAAPYFPMVNNEKLPILVLPLHLMDRTFTKYFRADIKSAFLKHIDKVKEVNGLSVILWHNSSVDELGFNGYWNSYDYLIKYLLEKDAWVTNAISLYNYWIERINFLTQM